MRLECRQLVFYYPGTQKRVLDHLSLGFEAPGFHAFFGPSGVGKTSLARLLIGELSPAAGRVDRRDIDTLLYSYNTERLPGWSSVGRHLERVTPAGKEAQKDALVRVFGISGLLDRQFSRLSLGQQNRINLVRYLVQEFQVLIMDESLANVDEKTRGRILPAIKEMFPEKIFIYISHNVVEVARFCRSIWVLRSPGKTPQAISVQGQDQHSGKDTDQGALQRTMLEMMNAA